MTRLKQIKQLAEKAVEVQSVDMTEEVAGGDFPVLDEGDYVCRFVEYIELGKQIQMMHGKPSKKPPQPMARFGFVVYDKDGSEHYINTFPKVLSQSEKAATRILFKKMKAVYPDTTHFLHPIGNAFKVHVTVSEKESTKKKYNNIEFNSIATVPKFDPNDGTPIVVPELDEDKIRVFSFDYPTQEDWDSLYIEGKRDDGTSKNFLQEQILTAVNYKGSKLDQLLNGSIPAPSDLNSDESEDSQEDVGEEEKPKAKPSAPKRPKAPSAPKLDEEDTNDE